MKQAHYSQSELADMVLDDLRSDINHAERQAKNGPFYPPDVTAETLRAYAESCRQKIRDLGGKA